MEIRGRGSADEEIIIVSRKRARAVRTRTFQNAIDIQLNLVIRIVVIRHGYMRPGTRGRGIIERERGVSRCQIKRSINIHLRCSRAYPENAASVPVALPELNAVIPNPASNRQYPAGPGPFSCAPKESSVSFPLL